MRVYEIKIKVIDNHDNGGLFIFETVESYLRWTAENRFRLSDRFVVSEINAQQIENLSADLAQKPTDPEEPPVSC